MKSYLTVVMLIVSTTLLFSQKSRVDQQWLIVPGESVGYLTKSTDLKKVLSIYGDTDLKHLTRETVIYPDTPNEFTIVWSDENRSEIDAVHITGTFGSKWKTKEGISLMQELPELVKANGADITFPKFGKEAMKVIDRTPKKTIVSDWGEGQFSNYGEDLEVELIYNFACEETELNIHRYQGSGLVSTDDPLLYTVQIFVNEIRVKL